MDSDWNDLDYKYNRNIFNLDGPSKISQRMP